MDAVPLHAGRGHRPHRRAGVLHREEPADPDDVDREHPAPARVRTHQAPSARWWAPRVRPGDEPLVESPHPSRADERRHRPHRRLRGAVEALSAATMTTQAGPLTGLRVVDATATPDAVVASSLLAGLGADVVILEEDGGHAARHVGPRVGDVSLLWKATGRNKRAVRLSDATADRAQWFDE